MRCAFCLCVLIGALAVVARPQTPKGDEAAIRSLEQNFAAAVRAKDINRIMAGYERGPKLVFFDVVPRPVHTGWDAYRKDWQAFLATFQGPVTFEINGLDITVGGSFAYGFSFQHVAGTSVDGTAKDYTVRVTDVYRKTGGKWLIVQEHVSVPVDLKTGKPDLRPNP